MKATARKIEGVAAGRVTLLGPLEHVVGGGRRTVRLYVPRAYDASVAHRALYLFDGQNVFDDAPSFAGGWHVDDAIERVTTRHRRPPVVVAIDHGGERRISELSPWDVGQHVGKLDALLDWVAKTVMPAVAEKVHVGYGAVHHAIGGSSLGGLAALYAHFQRPEIFGGAIAMSPSLWVGGGRLLAWLEGKARPAVSRVYLDAGAREGRGGLVVLAERLSKHLRARGYDTGSLRFRADPKGSHNEASWRRRMPSALRFMYP